jgi:hypothetical protein
MTFATTDLITTLYVLYSRTNMIMSLKTKIINMVRAHSKLVTFGIGFVITFVVGAAMGMVDHSQVIAATATNTNNGGNAA